MPRKIAALILHGIGDGSGEDKFMNSLNDNIVGEFEKLLLKNKYNIAPREALCLFNVKWGDLLQPSEDLLWNKIQGDNLHFKKLRKFVVNFASDALAYQPSLNERDLYDKIHSLIAAKLALMLNMGVPNDAPLFFIGYSLGSIISSNYIYDVQRFADGRKELVAQKQMASMMSFKTHSIPPLQSGKTIAGLYTIGCPLGLWSLRYSDFGTPVQIPSKDLVKYHPDIKGEWLNFYDVDDVIGSPLKGLNDAYDSAVTEDIEVKSPGPMFSKTPLDHSFYCNCKDVYSRIALGLFNAWENARSE